MYSNHNDTGQDWSVICDICGKKIATKEKLKYHLRTHTGDRPFACASCPRKFPKKDQLKVINKINLKIDRYNNLLKKKKGSTFKNVEFFT